MPYKIPISILAIIYNEKQQVLLLKRTNSENFWQSVTGSLDTLQEDINFTASREIFEETNIKINTYNQTSINAINKDFIQTSQFYTLYNLNHKVIYTIYAQFLYKYAKNITKNTEHWFCVKIPSTSCIKLSPTEHTAYQWVEWKKAYKLCFSPSNKLAIKFLFK